MATESTTWTERLHAWVTTVDHKRIGVMYVLYALTFLVVGGIEAALMRIQLIRPHADFVSPQVFNQLFTLHGTTMIFFVAMPLLFGFVNYLVPIMIGARDMAFPRLNAFSFWLTAFAGLLFYFSILGGYGLYGEGNAPDVGWWAYAPLTAKAFSRGHSSDYWTLSLLVAGFGTIATSVNIIATVFGLRCRGMTLGKMPLFVWLSLTMSVLAILAIGPLTAAQAMLLVDRYLGGHFFDTQAGGSAVLWMHFFWVFGHPEVYVLVIPAFGFASEIIPVFSRKPVFGYLTLVGATMAITALSVVVWAHHMFATGAVLLPFFSLLSFLIAVPTGVKFFNWIGTMRGGSLSFEAPMLWAVGFMVSFLFGGLTGVILASPPLDFHVTDSYFVVGHFHYVVFGTVVFAMFAGFYFWWPKFTGKMLDERLARIHFWTLFTGFHLTFLVQHWLGAEGMPRRYADYLAADGFTALNTVSTIGAFLLGLSTLPFLYNVWKTARYGREVEADDPWGFGRSLEWATSCPPPRHNFLTLPRVRTESPAFDLHHPEVAQIEQERDQQLTGQGSVSPGPDRPERDRPEPGRPERGPAGP